MDEHSSKILYIIAAVIISLVIIGVVISQVNSGTETTRKATNTMNEKMTAMEESEYTQYDGLTITGSELVSYIKSLSNDTICISVDNGSGTKTEYIYQSDLTTKSTATLADASNKANTNTYINPGSKFLGATIRDDQTDGIVRVEFTKQ